MSFTRHLSRKGVNLSQRDRTVCARRMIVVNVDDVTVLDSERTLSVRARRKVSLSMGAMWSIHRILLTRNDDTTTISQNKKVSCFDEWKWVLF